MPNRIMMAMFAACSLGVPGLHCSDPLPGQDINPNQEQDMEPIVRPSRGRPKNRPQAKYIVVRDSDADYYFDIDAKNNEEGVEIMPHREGAALPDETPVTPRPDGPTNPDIPGLRDWFKNHRDILNYVAEIPEPRLPPPGPGTAPRTSQGLLPRYDHANNCLVFD